VDDSTDASFDVTQQTDADGSLVLVVTGDVDLLTAPALERGLRDLAQQRPPRAILDLAAVSFIDSSGVRAIISGHRVLEEGSTTLVLRSPSDAARRLLEITGLDSVLTIEA
jgi:anti-sigma B factor antagonist